MGHDSDGEQNSFFEASFFSFICVRYPPTSGRLARSYRERLFTTQLRTFEFACYARSSINSCEVAFGGNMEKLRSLWAWMIAVMIAMQLGIALDYWGDFTSNTWAVHVHYWNATAWYAFLIVQPWLFAKGRMEAHRTWGMVGLLLAGAMVLLSVGQLNRDIVYANSVRDVPEQWGPFEPWFFFQIMMIEMVLISAFAIAIVMAIVKRKSIADHAWWMASTAFILIMPALARGIQNVWIMIYGFTAEAKNVLTEPLYLTQSIIIGVTLLFAWRFDKLKHPATWLAVLANATLFFMEPVARSPAVQEFWRAMIAH